MEDFNENLSGRSRRKLTLFSFCLLFSVAAWLFSTLSKKYNYEVNSVIILKNAPAGSIMAENNNISVRYQVESTGWQLIFLKIKKFPDSLIIDISKIKNQSKISLSNYFPVLNDQLDDKFLIGKVSPDVLNLGQVNVLKRKVPVKLNLTVEFADKFYSAGKIICKPDSVEISGSAQIVNKILFWPTEKRKLTLIKNSQEFDLNLEKLSLNVQIEPKVIMVKLPVEEFTENKIELPLKVINMPENYSIKVYPAVVNVSYLVSLSNFSQISANDFEAVVDYSLIEKGSDYLKAELIRFPESTLNQKIRPTHINYLLRP